MEGWAVLLPGIALLVVFNKWVNPQKGENYVAIATVLIAAAAGCGLADLFLGHWIADLIAWLGSTAGGGKVELGINVSIAILLIGAVVCDIAFDKKADKAAQISALLLPTILALVVGGALHQRGGDAVDSVRAKMVSFVTQAGEK